MPDSDAGKDFLPSDNIVFIFAGEGDHVLSLSSLLAPNYHPPLEGMSKFCLRFCFFEAASYYVDLSCYILLDSTWTSWSDVCNNKNVFLIIGSHTLRTKGSVTFTEANHFCDVFAALGLMLDLMLEPYILFRPNISGSLTP